MPLEYITFPEHPGNSTHAIIALHGRSANKTAFLPFARRMDLPNTLWILPSATYPSPGSHDIRWWFEHEEQNIGEIRRSRRQVHDLISDVIAEDIPPDRVFVLGFSQGAVMAMDTVLRYPLRLGGLLALSGYLAHADLLARERHPANAHIPIFLAHGTHDPLLPVSHGRECRRVLGMMGYPVEYFEYDTGHRISSTETRDIRLFLLRHFGETV